MSKTKPLNGPVIDWDLGTQLAGNKADLAKELLCFLVNRLPNDIEEIKFAHKNNNLQQVKQLVHKLHGATSYCGVPRLTTALAMLTTELKQQGLHPDSLVTLEQEAAQVIEHVAE